MINIKGLKAKTASQQILNGVDLTVNPGETHVIMGPNGAGKSTLSKLIAAHPDYELTAGEILFKGNNIKDLSTEERAQQGIFLGFQYPTEIPGVNNLYFLRAAYNAKQAANDKPLCDAVDFMKLYKEKSKLLDMDKRYQTRSVNAGFSGGEKKRNEILQMLILEPELAVLDETDSGLDIDALKTISTGINHFRNSKRAILLITHYQRLLDYVKPDYVHVMIKGRIVKSGGPELALELEKQGYAWLEDAAAEAL